MNINRLLLLGNLNYLRSVSRRLHRWCQLQLTEGTGAAGSILLPVANVNVGEVDTFQLYSRHKQLNGEVDVNFKDIKFHGGLTLYKTSFIGYLWIEDAEITGSERKNPLERDRSSRTETLSNAFSK